MSTACSVNPAAKSISVALGDGGGKGEGRRISRIQFPISSLLLSPSLLGPCMAGAKFGGSEKRNLHFYYHLGMFSPSLSRVYIGKIKIRKFKQSFPIFFVLKNSPWRTCPPVSRPCTSSSWTWVPCRLRRALRRGQRSRTTAGGYRRPI